MPRSSLRRHDLDHSLPPSQILGIGIADKTHRRQDSPSIKRCRRSLLPCLACRCDKYTQTTEHHPAVGAENAIPFLTTTAPDPAGQRSAPDTECLRRLRAVSACVVLVLDGSGRSGKSGAASSSQHASTIAHVSQPPANPMPCAGVRAHPPAVLSVSEP